MVHQLLHASSSPCGSTGSTLARPNARLNSVTDETLETGYGPGAPPGDTLANDFVQESAASFAGFARARGDRVRADRGCGHDERRRIAPAVPEPGRRSSSRSASSNRFLAEPARLLRRRPAGRRSCSTRRGRHPTSGRTTSSLMGHPPLMVRPPELELPPAPPELRIVRVDDERTAFDFEHTLAYGYPGAADAAGREGHDAHAGRLDRRRAGITSSATSTTNRSRRARRSVGERLLRVDNIATLAEVRGRGYGRAITAATIARRRLEARDAHRERSRAADLREARLRRDHARDVLGGAAPDRRLIWR